MLGKSKEEAGENEIGQNRKLGMSDEIKIGDYVRLNSGSPDLLVEALRRDNLICSWMNDQGEEKHEYFPRDAVHKIDRKLTLN